MDCFKPQNGAPRVRQLTAGTVPIKNQLSLAGMITSSLAQGARSIKPTRAIGTNVKGAAVGHVCCEGAEKADAEQAQNLPNFLELVAQTCERKTIFDIEIKYGAAFGATR
jgi:hypothetical protein